MELLLKEYLPHIGIAILILLVIISFLQKRYWSKHAKNIRSARRVLTKIRNPQKVFSNGQTINYLRKIDPFVFEELLLLCFKEQGYRIKRNKKYTGDGGIDGTIYNAKGNKIFVQAKRYSSYVNPSHITDFLNTIAKSKASGGYFVHTGKTGPQSYLNTNKKIYIISGSKLLKLVMIQPIHKSQRIINHRHFDNRYQGL